MKCTQMRKACMWREAEVEEGGETQPGVEKYFQQIQRRLISLCKRMIKKTESCLP